MIDATITTAFLFDAAKIVNDFLSADASTIYLLVLGFMIVESSFIPFPSEVIVPPAAYVACTSGSVNIWLVLLLATVGAVIGALINYGLSLWIGRPLVYRFADSRIGHACLIDRAKVDHAEQYFDRHGAASTFIGRLIPAVRQLISIPAGLSRMRLTTFITYTALGAGVWNAILAALGYWLGTIVPREALYEKVEQYNQYLTYAGAALGIGCLIFIIYRMLSNKHNTSNNNKI